VDGAAVLNVFGASGVGDCVDVEETLAQISALLQSKAGAVAVTAQPLPSQHRPENRPADLSSRELLLLGLCAICLGGTRSLTSGAALRERSPAAQVAAVALVRCANEVDVRGWTTSLQRRARGSLVRAGLESMELKEAAQPK
jgi:hypothetical protein